MDHLPVELLFSSAVEGKKKRAVRSQCLARWDQPTKRTKKKKREKEEKHVTACGHMVKWSAIELYKHNMLTCFIIFYIDLVERSSTIVTK